MDDIKKWREVNDFFFIQEIKIYNNNKLTKKEKNKLLKQLRIDWADSNKLNNPFLKLIYR